MFEHISGLKINLGKSDLIGINVVEALVNYLVESIGCERLSWPIVHLGAPLGGKPRSKTFWERIEGIITTHLESWKGGPFSLGEKITLMKCVSV